MNIGVYFICFIFLFSLLYFFIINLNVKSQVFDFREVNSIEQKMVIANNTKKSEEKSFLGEL